MFRAVKDFLDTWENETSSTLKIFNNLTNDSLGHRGFDEGRTIGGLAWHITVTVGEMFAKTGFEINAPDENSEPPADISTIVSTYENLHKDIASKIQTSWTDEMLGEELDMYGEKWKRGFMLSGFLYHEAHHRGQLTVLMRLAGLKVTGPYGPSKEEWVTYGMEAPVAY